MSGSLKIVVDTNVFFMALYNPEGKAGKLIKFANKNKIQLFAPDSVKIELIRVIKRELNFTEEEILKHIEKLPVVWIEKAVYESVLSKTKVKHKADKPVEAVALILDCNVLSANRHFKEAKNINELLREIDAENEDNKFLNKEE